MTEWNEEEYLKRAEQEQEQAREILEVGQIWVKYPELHEDHPNRKVMEIRGFVDNQVVYRFWMKTKGYFGYGMESLYAFALDMDLRGGGKRGPALVKAQAQEWALHGVNPEDDDLIG